MRRVARLCVIAMLIAFGLVTTLYIRATRPQQLRSAVSAVFERLQGAHAVVGDVSFSPWEGLRVERLRILYDESVSLPVSAGDVPPIADVADARIRCNWRALLLGRFEPTEITAASATVSAIHDASSLSSLDILPDDETDKDRRSFDCLPFTIDRVDVNLWRVADGELRLGEHWRLAARGRPAREDSAADADCDYAVRFHPVGKPRLSLAELKLNRHDSILDLSLNWLSLRTAQLTSTLWPASGARVRQLLDDLDLEGELQLVRLRMRDTQLVDVDVALRGISGSLPIEVIRNADGTQRVLAPDERFMHFTAGTGTLRSRENAIDGQMTVLLNGEPATLAVRCTPPAGTQAIELGGTAPAFERWGVSVEATVRRLAFPTREDQPNFVESPRLPGPARAFFRDYEPRGEFAMWIAATRAPDDGTKSDERRWDSDIRVNALGAACSYYRFTLPVTDVYGGFRARNSVITFTDLTARYGSGTIFVSGTLDEPRNWTGFDLRFRGVNIPLDEGLYKALSSTYRRLWDDTRPMGLCDIDVTLRRPPGSRAAGPGPTQTDVTARLLAGSANFNGQRLQHMAGVVTIDDGAVAARGLRATYGPASVHVSGRASAKSDGGVGRHWRFCVAGLPIDETITYAAGGQESTIAGATDSSLRFQGMTDVWGQDVVTGAPECERLATIRINDGQLSTLDGTQTWRNASGWLVLDENTLDLRTFTCTSGTSTFTASGTMGRHGQGASALTINTASEDMSDLIRQVVPARWSRVARALGLHGSGAVALRYGRDATASPTIAGIELTADQMRPSPLPLPLQNVHASLDLGPDGFVLHSSQARYPQGGHIGVTGRGEWQEGRTPWQINVEAEDLPIDDQLVAAMPEGFRTLLQRMRAGGRLRVPKEREITITCLDNERWQVSGVLLLSGAELDIGLELKQFDGRLETQHSDEPGRPDHVVIGGGGTDATVDFHINSGTLADRSLQDCDGTLRIARDQTWVHIDDVSGWFCGGELSGFGKVQPATGDYQVSVTLHDLSYHEFFKSHLPKDRAPSQARLDGRVSLRGSGGNASTRRGNGTLRIRGASILNMPVLANVAELSRGTRRKMTSNAEIIELDFDWVGAVFHIKRIDIRAGATHLVGKGRWNIQTNAISLTLVAAPSELALVPPFSLLDIAREELAQYRVTGTLSDAKVTLEPLHNVTEALRNIIERPPGR